MNKFTLNDLFYSKNLIENYQKLSSLPGFVLLESSDHGLGRYDIVSAYPYDIVQLTEDCDSFDNLFDRLQRSLIPHKSVIDLPFQGGAIGYFSYDLAQRIYSFHQPMQRALIKVPLMKFGLYDWAIITDHHTKKVSLFAANNHSETEKIIKEILERWQSNSAIKSSFQVGQSFKPLIEKEAYQKAFESIHHDLKKGRCYQVNYTQPFVNSMTGDPWFLYKQIRDKNPLPFSAFLREQDFSVLSFSPERFLQGIQGNLLTSPIKGTIKRGRTAEEDFQLKQKLQASLKNRAENVMIVDLLRNDLAKVAVPGSIHLRALWEIQSFEAVHHLVSHIQAICQTNVTSTQAIKACFPGGSITGAPKIEAMRVISEQEPFARGIYCGNIGYFSHHGNFDTNIAIRTITVQNNQLHLFVGGGIVIDSKWKDEYRECLIKMKAIQNGLHLFSK